MTFDELVAYLDSADNAHGLDSVSTHGFLTATVVGKPLVNWQAVYFEGKQDEVGDEVKLALSAWQQRIEDTLKNEAPVELPFDGEEEEDFGEESDVVAWSIGFIMAMYDEHAQDWFADSDSEEDVAELTLPMLILSGLDENNEDLAMMRQDPAMLAELANSLESNVTELYLLFHTDEDE